LGECGQGLSKGQDGPAISLDLAALPKPLFRDNSNDALARVEGCFMRAADGTHNFTICWSPTDFENVSGALFLIGALGFRVEDVEILLQSHEHFDHVAGLAELQRRSGEKLIATTAAAAVMASGRSSEDDPQFGMHDPADAASDAGLVDTLACRNYAASISDRLDARLAEESSDEKSAAAR
jgi:hypothetical protein